jgi:hypothetical protein
MLRALTLFKIAPRASKVTKAAEPVKTLAVVEKKSVLASTALSVGGGVVKTTAVVGGIGLVGAGAQQFKNSLFSDLGNIADGNIGSSLGNIGSSLGDALGGATDSLMTGVLIIGGVVVVGVLYKVLKK